MRKVHEVLPHDANEPLHTAIAALVETAVFNIVSLLILRKNAPYLHSMLRHLIDKNILDPKKLQPEERSQLGQNILQVGLQMRKDPAFARQKQLFGKILAYAGELLQAGNLEDQKSFKLALIASFNRGIMHLEEKEFGKAQKVFEECLALFDKYFPEPNSDLFNVLFNIGASLNGLGKPNEAEFFFAKIVKMAPDSENTKTKAIKALARNYFRQGEHAKCRGVLRDWVKRAFSEPPLPEKFHKYLTMYFLCCQKLKVDDFEEQMRVFEREFADNNEQQHYRGIFQAMNRPNLNSRTYAENECALEKI